MPDRPICPRCGATQRPAGNFCGACGQPMRPPPTPAPGGTTARQRRGLSCSRRPWLLLLVLCLLLAGAAAARLARTAARETTEQSPARTAISPSARPSLPTSAPVERATARPSPPTPATSDGQLAVHFIDVGQGDSMLVQTPDGITALIDGGYDNDRALRYLQAHGVRRIDVLVASHPHADHLGGLVQVLRAMPVGVVWTSGASHTTATYEQFLDAIADARVSYREARQGDTIPIGALGFEVLRSDPTAPELNDTSLVLRLAHDQVSFLFTGDAEGPSEAALLRDDPSGLAATILKVGHHGSYTSSSPAFVAAVAPEVAVYSAGVDNSYGHPHAETIATLEAAGARIYGTAVDGTVVITSDGQGYVIRTERPRTGQHTPLPPEGGDRDCGDFATHAEAQRFFEAAGGPARDPHRLDGDDDGSACEALP